MDIKNLINQLSLSSNPMMSIMGMLTPQQQNIANSFLQGNDEQKAQQIADYCNKNGINKQQLQGLINQMKK